MCSVVEDSLLLGRREKLAKEGLLSPSKRRKKLGLDRGGDFNDRTLYTYYVVYATSDRI